MEIISEIKKLVGPILILGASGFIGANLFRKINVIRQDVFGTGSRLPAWRMQEFSEQTICADFLLDETPDNLLERAHFGTVFDCIAYGGNSVETDIQKTYKINLLAKINLINKLVAQHSACCYIHAGSSSEYGIYSNAPFETVPPTPNSHYA